MSTANRPGRTGGFPLKRVLLLLAVFVAGMLVLGGVNGFFAYTNKTEFCTSCHTMQWNHEEYKTTAHFNNASGVQTGCADCHVPKEFGPKVWSKLVATKDIYHHVIGTIDTKEKFEEHRWEMANRVWDKMRATDSRECRGCHDIQNMDLELQTRIARNKHSSALEKGQTCIDCHQGIAHRQPDPPLEDIQL
ncbi:MAG: NapC/NirT family cytochrome c [Gammaproteobacteria bacterium]|nr:NapC/NirT family cytochrome c [Gammaproteobacteria bacterium]MCW8841651.1 NapC/NirT family cytochrome c [Gammaproteobacteria bacterium]MCW8928290.1 NapC/NirT family cytochrome c [Gammaproteobacteria bacterium]MCW8974031.1 NapC/NirT family cytochrome c [Gammaproteobacteria bacterium]MCW8993682.1 NapC/NirT family cytochrome c [Gammaproteobacteria bacterium]